MITEAPGKETLRNGNPIRNRGCPSHTTGEIG